jgi:hypothetical protein
MKSKKPKQDFIGNWKPFDDVVALFFRDGVLLIDHKANIVTWAGDRLKLNYAQVRILYQMAAIHPEPLRMEKDEARRMQYHMRTARRELHRVADIWIYTSNAEAGYFIVRGWDMEHPLHNAMKGQSLEAACDITIGPDVTASSFKPFKRWQHKPIARVDLTEIDFEKITDLRKRGYKISEIAAMVRVPYTQVWDLMRSHGTGILA